MNNLINWFEIPVTDITRASKFYSAILNEKIEPSTYAGVNMAFFPGDGTNVTGALVQCDGYVPSMEGTFVYLNGGDDLNSVLSRVETAGGKVLAEKMLISEEAGYCAFFLDTEGNKVGVHSAR